MATFRAIEFNAPSPTHVRAFLAGTGASGSLLVAAVVAFLAVTTFVAFDDLPFGGGANDGESISLPDGATALAGAGAATGTDAGGAVSLGAATAGGGDGGGTAAPGAPDGAGAPGPGGGPVGTPAGPGTPPAVSPPATPAVPAPLGPPAAPNPVDEALAGLDGAIQDATGVNPNLAGATKPVTGVTDQAVQGLTGDDLGGHLGKLTGG
jgi:hypothetical protein